LSSVNPWFAARAQTSSAMQAWMPAKTLIGSASSRLSDSSLDLFAESAHTSKRACVVGGSGGRAVAPQMPLHHLRNVAGDAARHSDRTA